MHILTVVCPTPVALKQLPENFTCASSFLLFFFSQGLKASFIFTQSFPELSLSDLLPKVPQNQVCSSPFKNTRFCQMLFLVSFHILIKYYV